MYRNDRKKTGSGLKVLAVCLVSGMLFWGGSPVRSYASATAKVVANSGRIREKADKSSETLGSVEKGNTLDVISQTKDSDGYVWYKVYVNKDKTGYIRSDLVTVDGEIPGQKEESKAESSDSKEETKEEAKKDTAASEEKKEESGGNVTVVGSNGNTTTEKKEEKTETKTETVVVAVNVKETDVTAVKMTDTVRVRKGAGTNFEVADVADAGTVASVSGVAADSQGKNWYQITFEKNGKTVSGFVREDLAEVQEQAAEPEEEIEEMPDEEGVTEEPAAVNNDYSLEYMQNGEGEMEWFLIDNIQGTRQSLTQWMDAVDQAEENEEAKEGQSSLMRMIIVAMAAAIVILIIVVTILLFKLHDAEYEYEYEEDEDDEEEEEETDAEEQVGSSVSGSDVVSAEAENEDEEEDEDERQHRRPAFGFLKKKDRAEKSEKEDEEDEIPELKQEKPEKTAKENNKSWQSKDFLELEEDLEFEFLDL